MKTFADGWVARAVFAAGLAGTLCGCERLNPAGGTGADTPSSRVVIVDVDAVAKAVGRDRQMQQRLESARKQLGEQITSYATDLKSQLEQRLAEGGKEAEVGKRHEPDKTGGRDRQIPPRPESARKPSSEPTSGHGTDLKSPAEQRLAEAGPEMDDGKRRELERAAVQARQTLQTTIGRAEEEIQRYRLALIQEFRDQLRPVAERVARSQGAEIVFSALPNTLWFAPAVDLTDEVIAELRANPLPEPAPFRVQTGKAAPVGESEGKTLAE